MDAMSVRPPRHAHPADLPAIAERDMLTLYAAALDVPPLAPRVVALDGGGSMQVDGATADEDLFVIPIAHQGPLPEDTAAHLARDVFALSLATASRPHARAILLFACARARQSAQELVERLGGSQSLELAVVDLGQEWTERLVEATRPAGRHRAAHAVPEAAAQQSASQQSPPQPAASQPTAPQQALSRP